MEDAGRFRQVTDWNRFNALTEYRVCRISGRFAQIRDGQYRGGEACGLPHGGHRP